MGKRKVNVMWDRVSGKDLDPKNAIRAERNKNTMRDETFLDACKAVNVEPTKRQSSKYNNKKGMAYRHGRGE